MEERLVCIENKIEKIEEKIEPLIELIQTLINKNINTKNTEEKELCYKIKDNQILIYGSKTYDHKETIKSNFTDASWNKKLSSWVISYSTENIEKIQLLFQNIIKDQ